MNELPERGYEYESPPGIELREQGIVELSGFGGIAKSQREAANHIIGNYMKRFTSHCKRMEQLHVTMKDVHKGKHQKKVEVRGRLVDNGKSYTSQVVDHDLLVGLDKALQKLENSVAR